MALFLVNEEWCIGCGLCAWSCPYGAREMDPSEGVMKKCTLCVDRIYNENLPAEDQVPACVRTCPTSARHFGDLGDPGSDVSQLVAARGGFDLMPEQNTKPVNKYLPPGRGEWLLIRLSRCWRWPKMQRHLGFGSGSTQLWKGWGDSLCVLPGQLYFLHQFLD